MSPAKTILATRSRRSKSARDTEAMRDLETDLDLQIRAKSELINLCLQKSGSSPTEKERRLEGSTLKRGRLSHDKLAAYSLTEVEFLRPWI